MVSMSNSSTKDNFSLALIIFKVAKASDECA